MASHEEATAYKAQVASTQVAPATTPTWHTVVEPNAQAAVTFLNLPPAQVAGQAFATDRDDGSLDVFYFL